MGNNNSVCPIFVSRFRGKVRCSISLLRSAFIGDLAENFTAELSRIIEKLGINHNRPWKVLDQLECVLIMFGWLNSVGWNYACKSNGVSCGFALFLSRLLPLGDDREFFSNFVSIASSFDWFSRIGGNLRTHFKLAWIIFWIPGWLMKRFMEQYRSDTNNFWIYFDDSFEWNMHAWWLKMKSRDNIF